MRKNGKKFLLDNSQYHIEIRDLDRLQYNKIRR
jgi:hypothetical protein